VSDARDDAPLRRARVNLVIGGTQVNDVFTDDGGRFELRNLQEGPAMVRVTKAGYAAAQVDVSTSRAGAELRFRLARSAAVMGRVVDSAGAPVAGVQVSGRLVIGTADPAPRASTQFVTQTDRLGEYRLGGLPAGRYVLTAGPTAALESARASSLSLRPGDQLHSIDFTMAGISETCREEPSFSPPAGGRGSIAGRVTSASGEPIPCAIVRFMATGPQIPQVYTDRQGRYALEGLSTGSFIVLALKSGYLPLRYGQRDPGDAHVAVVLREGERRDGIDLVLPRESILTGTVMDEHGEPLEGVAITPVQYWGNERPSRLLMTASARPTDDRGHYRVIGLVPGTYVVSARVRGELFSDGRTTGYNTTYYPGTGDSSMARRVTVEAGRDFAGVDIVVAPTTTATVRGTVVDTAGAPFSGPVSMAPSRQSAGLSVESWSTTADRTGAFVLRNVPPGRYVLKAPATPQNSDRFGMAYASVSDGDPAPVTIKLSEGASLEGRFVLETAFETNVAGLTVSFAPTDPDATPTGGFRAPLFGREDNGTFRMTGLFGPTRIVVPRLPACDTCYLKAVRINGGDATDNPFDFGVRGGMYRGAEVVIADGGAVIEGLVKDERDAPAVGASVVAVSAYEELRFPGSRHLKWTGTSAAGTFRLAGLPPGDYVIGAVRRIDALINIVPEQDLELLDVVAARGQRVTVIERERRALDLRQIQR
jgi:hypothetical protein